MSSRDYKIGEKNVWLGGKCPVPPETKVIIRFRDSHSFTSENSAVEAGRLRWSHEEWPGDITGFEVISYPPIEKINVPTYEIGVEYPWKGGKAPIPPKAVADILFRTGATHVGTVEEIRWEHNGLGGDIVKFKVISFPSVVSESTSSSVVSDQVIEELIEASENPSYAPRMVTLFHATTPAKAKKYRDGGKIHGPVRGFTTLQAAMAWAIKVNRTVIYEVFCEDAHKLPDHHNRFGEAWWNDGDVTDFKCVFSADTDA